MGPQLLTAWWGGNVGLCRCAHPLPYGPGLFWFRLGDVAWKQVDYIWLAMSLVAILGMRHKA